LSLSGYFVVSLLKCLFKIFQNADAVELALKLDGEELNKRKLRVQRCVKKPVRKSGSSREHTHAKDRKKDPKINNNEQTTMKKEHNDKKDVDDDPDSDTMPKGVHTKSSQEFSHFQGQKVGEDEKLKKVILHCILSLFLADH
jgi:hypothetical protein